MNAISKARYRENGLRSACLIYFLSSARSRRQRIPLVSFLVTITAQSQVTTVTVTRTIQSNKNSPFRMIRAFHQPTDCLLARLVDRMLRSVGKIHRYRVFPRRLRQPKKHMHAQGPHDTPQRASLFLATVTNTPDIHAPELQEWHHAARTCRCAALDDIRVRVATAAGKPQNRGA